MNRLFAYYNPKNTKFSCVITKFIQKKSYADVTLIEKAFPTLIEAI
jgi:hypothetical protein